MRKFKHVRKQKSDRPMKFIRVNHFTVIETSIDTPDNVVRENFIRHQTNNLNALKQQPKTGIDFFK